MNQEYFDYITVEIDRELEREAERIINTKKYADRESEQVDKFIMSGYPFGDESKEDASIIATRLINVLKRLIEKNDDFNTNMLAFVNLYNYLTYKKIIIKIEPNIIESLSDVFTKDWEKSYFFDLLHALNSLDEIDFIKLRRIYPELEITYMCLAEIYFHKIFDFRVDASANDYERLTYCISKISDDMRHVLFYGYSLLNMGKYINIKTDHYWVCLPQINERSRKELEEEYVAGDNENINWSDWLAQVDDQHGHTLYSRLTVVDYEILYNKIKNLVCQAGDYMGELRKKYSELKALQDERYRLIRDFSHTYENMQAMGLKEIANILMDSDDYQIKQCGRVILAEYGMKDSLKAEVNLLRLNFENKRDDIIQLIRKGVSYDENDSSINVNSIFEEALKICLLRVIYSGNPRGEDQIAKGMYKRIKARVGSMKGFVQNFENKVILNGIGVQYFLNDMGINIDFCSDDEWNKLFFEKNKHAEVLIRSIFAELITNSFKYANLNDTIFYSLKLSNGTYVLQQTNTFTELTVSESGIGLESKGEILKKINGYESCGVEKILNKYEGGNFTTFFLMDSKLFNVQEDIGNV